jgi:D-alanyl-lipoteichoic acid acyltransferase DltB (MBOAT superfamily)
MFTSLSFVMGMVPAFLLLRLARAQKREWLFQISLLFVSLSFLGLLFDVSVSALAAFACIALVVGIGVKAWQEKSKHRSFAYFAALTLLLLVFFIAKYSALQLIPPLRWFTEGFAAIFRMKTPLAMVGISYFAFKLIQVMVDAYQEALPRLRFLPLMNYVFFFPVFLSGPIQRYGQFSENAVSERPEPSPPYASIAARFCLGLLKKLVVARIFFTASVAALDADALAQASQAQLVLGAVAYIIYIYFDFSGYCDLAISAARFLGFSVPENFQSPFVSLSIQEFWTRWHITLSQWIRDYLFYPAMRFLLNYFPGAPGFILPSLSMVFAFVLCGVWHGDAWHYVLYGLGHGLALGTYMTYTDLMKRKFKKRYAEWRKMPAYKAASWALTFSFVCFNTVFFSDNGIEVMKKFLGLS